ncbi:MAG: sensor histidine kinase [Clostridiales bacterium]|nr:sensor histidine kinase [Clostridiales bacterium]
MKDLVNKTILFLICMSLYLPKANSIYIIVPILITISFSAILSYLDSEYIKLCIFILFLFLCFLKASFLFFIPLICYDGFFLKFKWTGFLSYLPLINYSINSLSDFNWLIATLILGTFILKDRTLSLEQLGKNFYKLRDNTKEISLQLEMQNKELLEKQDYEIHLATLTERNRIARDIHDNVGHLLSRSILQIGALLATNKDELTRKSLIEIKNTLSEAMNSIRASVHNLHEKSIDLYSEIQKLVDNFTFCSIKFNYDLESQPEKNIKYCFIAVIKEALSNIIKHSNATEVSILLREHPALFQLVVQDNGSNASYKMDNGIGLKNIMDRVATINGNININTYHGFKIFISVPKNNTLERVESNESSSC